MTELEKYLVEQKRKEHIEHRDVLLAINSLATTKEGQTFIKYLFKNLEVGQFPPMDMSGNAREDYIGFLRAGNSIFKLISEANSEFAGTTLAKIERERYDDINQQYAIEHGLNQTTTRSDEEI